MDTGNNSGEVMTTEDICSLFHISRRTVYRWIESGKLKAQKIGKRFYYEPENVNALKAAAQLGGGYEVYTCLGLSLRDYLTLRACVTNAEGGNAGAFDYTRKDLESLEHTLEQQAPLESARRDISKG